MSYARVIPRDLFNEGKLLTCLGRLWILLEKNPRHRAGMVQLNRGRFEITQDPSDGAICCENVKLVLVGGESPWLFRPLNSRGRWALWARFGDPLGEFEDLEVFTPDGELAAEFWAKIEVPK